MNIEITPEERKSILQYFILIRSYGTDTAGAYYNFWQDNMEYDSGVYAKSKKIEVFKPVEVVMERILDSLDFNEFPEEFHDEDQEYYNISIDFDTKEKTIEVSGSFTVNGVEESFEEYEIDEDELEIFEDFLQRGVSEIICSYNGGGDSGYIDNNMGVDGSRAEMTADIEELCYKKLSNFGGWEINEGSQGSIVFNLEDKTITINHEWNTEEPRNFEIAKIKI
jgi:hypothetical protein